MPYEVSIALMVLIFLISIPACIYFSSDLLRNLYSSQKAALIVLCIVFLMLPTSIYFLPFVQVFQKKPHTSKKIIFATIYLLTVIGAIFSQLLF
jgi:hypothetical protein